MVGWDSVPVRGNEKEQLVKEKAISEMEMEMESMDVLVKLTAP